ncbi:protein EI24 homolog isoform X2 [Alnus glutinosa]|uniref:protein EI24 homolog isoform X2 n=1 Tax=Alnus glutinosa TaxID=3517 RepID=UPI002D781D8D|nr:protein EI24 homolog isoform X2 [Alnus glutinosa]
MEASKPLTNLYSAKLKQATLLWLEGFREACCLHRVFILCRRSRKLLIRTGQCFLLNGFIFLGSMFVLNTVVIPMLHWILPDQSSQFSSQIAGSFGGVLKFYSFVRLGLIQLFYVFWFYPLYVFSLILSNIWYTDIAKFGFAAMGRSGPSGVEPSSPSAKSTAHTERLAGLGGVMVGIGEQVYSVLLLSFFFLEVFATGFVPYVGKVLNFLLLSWIYKWNFSEVALDKRLDFFESNWPYFAGFGSPCVLAIFFFSPLVSYGVMAILFPLFVLTATSSGAEQDISFQRRKWKGVGLGRLPIFYAADTLSLRVLSLLPLERHDQMQDNKAH